MSFVELRDKKVIESYLRSNPELHIYSIGDLDDFFWPHTVWYGWVDRGSLSAIALLYTGQAVPTLLALDDDLSAIKSLTRAILHRLPNRFHAHLTPGLESVLQSTCRLDFHGRYLRMALRDRSIADSVDCTGVVNLSAGDLDAINRLYEQSYPANWFDQRMLETGQYFGVKSRDELVSIAGIHVYSAAYRVAALGNITTATTHRRRGLGTRVTARLLQSLRTETDHIGLNVNTDNTGAITLYKRLGFSPIARFEEFTIKKQR